MADRTIRITVLTRSLHMWGCNTFVFAPQNLKAPKLHCYESVKDAKELVIFLFDMIVVWGNKVRFIVNGDMKLWWHSMGGDPTRVVSDGELWENLKRELQTRFLPKNTKSVMWWKLRLYPRYYEAVISIVAGYARHVKGLVVWKSWAS